MNLVRFSVVIPAYNNAEYLGEAIQSVLDQTYPNFEIIIVNDASPDYVTEVVNQFTDPRIKYIVHERNLGLSAARNTGIRASSGEFIALLDGDDLFHPNKLKAHVDFLDAHPEIGVTYNARFELNHSSNTIREIWRPPMVVSLKDLVLGFPFSPSDMVIRREWILRVNLFDEYHKYVGEDLDINCRLGLEGCRFAGLDRALNYRRYHSGRKIKDLRASVEDTIRPLINTFNDPRCSQEVLELQNIAPSIHYMLWSIIAFDQNETELGQGYCLEAIKLNPSLLKGNPCLFLDSLVTYSVSDENRNHGDVVKNVFYQLPVELAWLNDHLEWAITQGYLRRGVRAVMWDRIIDGENVFAKAVYRNAQIDRRFLQQYTAQLLDYENEFGNKAAQDVFKKVYTYLEKFGDKSMLRWLKGHYLLSQAFNNYHNGKQHFVPGQVIQAVSNNPRYLKNRGVWSIFFRSLI